MSQQTTFKAEEYPYYDYWFTSGGIFRIKIISYRYIYMILVYCVFAIFGTEILPPNLALIRLILIFGPLGAAYFLIFRLTRDKRMRFGFPPSKAILENQKISTKMMWDDIKSVSLARRRSIRILVGNHAYRGTIKKQDYA